jgi:hypothetical protein
MKKRYSHTRIEAKRAAARALSKLAPKFVEEIFTSKLEKKA